MFKKKISRVVIVIDLRKIMKVSRGVVVVFIIKKRELIENCLMRGIMKGRMNMSSNILLYVMDTSIEI